MSSSVHRTISRTKVSKNSNWHELVVTSGETPKGGQPFSREKIATLIQLSDLHICDAASPARLEFLDRLADPDNPISQLAPYIGTYRAQEFLTTQVLLAMVDAVNQLHSGPLTGSPVDAVVITGDVIDNAQKNELEWYVKILDGGTINPKSGDSEMSEAAHSSHPFTYDPHYYHPDGPPKGADSDRPNLLHGFPHFSGLLSAAESEFRSPGLKLQWLAVHGNHDALLQGTAAPTPELNSLVTGNEKLAGLLDISDLPALFEGFGEVGPARYPGLERLETYLVTQDPQRRLIAMSDWVEAHTNCGHDHGVDVDDKSRSYWYRDINTATRLIGLDTVNRYGGWQGCVHREQFDWLRNVLDDSKDKYVIISSHHPLENLFNGYVPNDQLPPALIAEVAELLEQYPNVILWIAGHVHDHKIEAHLRQDGSHAFWKIRTASLIDWPQQGRFIEIVKAENGQLVIGTSVIDHSGPLIFNGSEAELSDPIALAGFSRELAGNDWQRFREGAHSFQTLQGEPSDRNVWLWAVDPLRLLTPAAS